VHYRAVVVSKQDLADGRRAALGARLRELRHHRNLTQEKLAVAAGMHRTFLTEIETARHSITLDRLHALADALSVTIHQLLPTDQEALGALHRRSGVNRRPRRMVLVELADEEHRALERAAEREGVDAEELVARLLLAVANGADTPPLRPDSPAAPPE
jgi:transcriptional regulator with XRE-family HTH domain